MKLVYTIAVAVIAALAHADTTAADEKPHQKRILPVRGEVQTHHDDTSPRDRPVSSAAAHHADYSFETADNRNRSNNNNNNSRSNDNNNNNNRNSCDRSENIEVALDVTTDDWGHETAIYLSRVHRNETKLFFSAPMQSLENNKVYERVDFCLPKKKKKKDNKDAAAGATDGEDWCYNLSVFDEKGNGVQTESPAGIFFYVDEVLAFYIDSEVGKDGKMFKTGAVYFGEGCS